MWREQYPYEYDVVVTMRIRAKEDLPEKDVIKSVETDLLKSKIVDLTETCLTDFHIYGGKRERNKNAPV